MQRNRRSGQDGQGWLRNAHLVDHLSPVQDREPGREDCHHRIRRYGTTKYNKIAPDKRWKIKSLCAGSNTGQFY